MATKRGHVGVSTWRIWLDVHAFLIFKIMGSRGWNTNNMKLMFCPCFQEGVLFRKEPTFVSAIFFFRFVVHELYEGLQNQTKLAFAGPVRSLLPTFASCPCLASDFLLGLLIGCWLLKKLNVCQNDTHVVDTKMV